MYGDLPDIFKQNKEIKSEVNKLVKEYLKNFHPNGWEILGGVKEYIKEEHFLIEAPVNDVSFGGFIRSTNTNKFICFINTAQPRNYQNFSLLHELYHLISFTKISGPIHMVEANLDSSFEERKADYFASLLLIDEHELVSFFNTLKEKELLKKILLTVLRFQAPYKAVIIRLYELDLINDEELGCFFDKNLNLPEEFRKAGLDPYVVEESRVITLGRVEEVMKKFPLPKVAQDSNSTIFKEVLAYFSSEKEG